MLWNFWNHYLIKLESWNKYFVKLKSWNQYCVKLKSWSQHLNAFWQVWGWSKAPVLYLPSSERSSLWNDGFHPLNWFMATFWAPSWADWREGVGNAKEDVNRIEPKLSWKGTQLPTQLICILIFIRQHTKKKRENMIEPKLSCW